MPLVTADDVEARGVVGAGGAGFPTHVKLRAEAGVVILNAAECEPLLHKDKVMLLHYADEVIAGLEATRELVGASESVIGVKGKYTEVIETIRPKLAARMKIQELSDSYPAGDEFVLVYDVTGKVIPPGKIPLAVGAVVINVETAYNIAMGQPVTRKYLTVAGAVANPITVQVPVGTSFGEAIELAGGATISDPCVIVGGVMMGRLSRSFSEPITKTTGGLIILPEDHVVSRRYNTEWKAISRIGASCCDQCSFCTEFCPRFLLGHPIEPHKAMRSLVYSEIGEANVMGTDFCCECNLCTMMACPEDLDPKNVCTQNKRRRASEGTRWQEPPFVVDRPDMHLNNRRTPIGRLIRKLGLSQFTNRGPLQHELYAARRVVLMLKQHVGAPALPMVKVGDTVKVGDVVAKPPQGQLGVPIHASIAGKVAAVGDKDLTITA